ncbi:Bm1 [Dirofilaria immitis]|nr:Bm1 [Dirofilaria immitis]
MKDEDDIQSQSNRNERTLYLCNIHPHISVDHIYETFSQAGPVEKVILHENTDGTPQCAIVIFKEVDSRTCVMFDLIRYQLGFDIFIHSSSIVISPSSNPAKLSGICYAPRQIGYEKKCAQKLLRCDTRFKFILTDYQEHEHITDSSYKNDTMIASTTTMSSKTSSQDAVIYHQLSQSQTSANFATPPKLTPPPPALIASNLQNS